MASNPRIDIYSLADALEGVHFADIQRTTKILKRFLEGSWRQHVPLADAVLSALSSGEPFPMVLKLYGLLLLKVDDICIAMKEATNTQTQRGINQLVRISEALDIDPWNGRNYAELDKSDHLQPVRVH